MSTTSMEVDDDGDKQPLMTCQDYDEWLYSLSLEQRDICEIVRNYESSQRHPDETPDFDSYYKEIPDEHPYWEKRNLSRCGWWARWCQMKSTPKQANDIFDKIDHYLELINRFIVENVVNEHPNKIHLNTTRDQYMSQRPDAGHPISDQMGASRVMLEDRERSLSQHDTEKENEQQMDQVFPIASISQIEYTRQAVIFRKLCFCLKPTTLENIRNDASLENGQHYATIKRLSPDDFDDCQSMVSLFEGECGKEEKETRHVRIIRNIIRPMLTNEVRVWRAIVQMEKLLFGSGRGVGNNGGGVVMMHVVMERSLFRVPLFAFFANITECKEDEEIDQSRFLKTLSTSSDANVLRDYEKSTWASQGHSLQEYVEWCNALDRCLIIDSLTDHGIDQSEFVWQHMLCSECEYKRMRLFRSWMFTCSYWKDEDGNYKSFTKMWRTGLVDGHSRACAVYASEFRHRPYHSVNLKYEDRFVYEPVHCIFETNIRCPDAVCEMVKTFHYQQYDTFYLPWEGLPDSFLKTTTQTTNIVNIERECVMDHASFDRQGALPSYAANDLSLVAAAPYENKFSMDRLQYGDDSKRDDNHPDHAWGLMWYHDAQSWSIHHSSDHAQSWSIHHSSDSKNTQQPSNDSAILTIGKIDSSVGHNMNYFFRNCDTNMRQFQLEIQKEKAFELSNEHLLRQMVLPNLPHFLQTHYPDLFLKTPNPEHGNLPTICTTFLSSSSSSCYEYYKVDRCANYHLLCNELMSCWWSVHDKPPSCDISVNEFLHAVAPVLEKRLLDSLGMNDPDPMVYELYDPIQNNQYKRKEWFVRQSILDVRRRLCQDAGADLIRHWFLSLTDEALGSFVFQVHRAWIVYAYPTQFRRHDVVRLSPVRLDYLRKCLKGVVCHACNATYTDYALAFSQPLLDTCIASRCFGDGSRHDLSDVIFLHHSEECLQEYCDDCVDVQIALGRAFATSRGFM